LGVLVIKFFDIYALILNNSLSNSTAIPYYTICLLYGFIDCHYLDSILGNFLVCFY